MHIVQDEILDMDQLAIAPSRRGRIGKTAALAKTLVTGDRAMRSSSRTSASVACMAGPNSCCVGSASTR